MHSDDERQQVERAYARRAAGYNQSLRLFDLFAAFGFNISGWRQQAIDALGLRPGDTVIDIGCGTGMNFPLLQKKIGLQGRIIAIDLSDAMVAHARGLVADHGWTNVEIICEDAVQFKFPEEVDAVISAYTLILVPGCQQVIDHACTALKSGGRLVVLDMAWPPVFPLWWRHVLFFLKSYGVTAEVIRRRGWEVVQQSMARRLSEYRLRKFWFGFFYLASGTRAR